MSGHLTRAAYVKAPWQFEIRQVALPEPGPGEMLVRVAACAVCGTDLHVADRMAQDWQPFGHEISGVVEVVGEAVTRVAPGDRVALDSSGPCGRCAVCEPAPFGRGRPDLCRSPKSYWGNAAMGYAERIITPHENAVAVPDTLPLDVASLTEPLGVSLDLVQTAAVRMGDHVLVIGPGPLGLGAAAIARRLGAERVIVAGRSSSVARLRAAEDLGADEVIRVDEQPLAEYNFGGRVPEKILVTAPPQSILEAIRIAPFGGTIAYIGIAWGPGAKIAFDADDFHFRKLSLRASHASPGTHAAEVIRLLETAPELGDTLISHRFALDELPGMLRQASEDRSEMVKMVMVGG